jgi:hypothetical protein
MPAHTILFWVTLPVLLGVVLYQIGPQVLLPASIHEYAAFKVLRSLFEETHCYASVTTLSTRLPNADCFSVSNGRFTRLFKDDLIKQDASYDAVKDARAGYVYPGLWDGHGHLIQYGELLNSVNLFGSESMVEVQNRLVQYKASHPEEGTDQKWIRGVGWDQAKFDGKWPGIVGDHDFAHGDRVLTALRLTLRSTKPSRTSMSCWTESMVRRQNSPTHMMCSDDAKQCIASG